MFWAQAETIFSEWKELSSNIIIEYRWMILEITFATNFLVFLNEFNLKLPDQNRT